MTKGYIYCMSNPSMPGIFKVGVTKRTIEDRLKEANKPDTWKAPTKFVVEFAKYVNNPFSQETIIHNNLYKYRITDSHEFFRADIKIIMNAFETIEGLNWIKSLEIKYEVAAILEKKQMNNKMFYKVHWKNYSITDATWEPEANLIEDGFEHLLREH
jgi:hypothetical protein